MDIRVTLHQIHYHLVIKEKPKITKIPDEIIESNKIFINESSTNKSGTIHSNNAKYKHNPMK